MNPPARLTEQLGHLTGADPVLADQVLREVLPRLRQIAARQLGREHPLAPLSPTELIHEVWLRRLRKPNWTAISREHFFCLAARAMRQVLVDQARRRRALQRDPGKSGFTGFASARHDELTIELGMAMAELERRDATAAWIADLHYFAGFTLEETAGFTRLSIKQVRQRWDKARHWLQTQLSR